MDFMKCESGWRGRPCSLCEIRSDSPDYDFSLWDAIHFGCIKHVLEALSVGAKANNKNTCDGETPLCKAARGGDPIANRDPAIWIAIMQILIQHGADVNKAATRGTTPLLEAAGKGKPAVVAFLLSQGAKVNVRTGDGWTALHTAAYSCGMEKWANGSKCGSKCGHYETARLLIEAGADVNARSTGRRRDRTPLHQAYMYDSKDIIDLLIAHGADVNAEDKDGIYPRGMSPF